MADARYKDITVRMLLNHSSGLLGSTSANWLLFNDNSTLNHDNLLKELKTQYLKYQPGSSSVYCNDGFLLAEILVEKVTNMTFTKYVESYITAPLGLKNTKTTQSTFKRTQLAKTYTTTKKETPYEYFNAIGTGGFFSTADDLCKFGNAMTNSCTTLLSSKSKEMMSQKEYAKGTWTDTENFLCYGLGWENVNTVPFTDYGLTAYTKTGDSKFYHGYLTVLPKQNITISVLSSGGAALYLDLFASKVLMKYLADKNIITQRETEKKEYTKAPLPENVKEYTGTYAGTINGNTIVSLKDDEFIITLAGKDFHFNYTTDQVFISSDYPNLVTAKFKKNHDKMLLEWTEDLNCPGLGTYHESLFLGQKISPVSIPANVKKAWQNRNGKKYYIISEKYSSVGFLLCDLDDFYYEFYYSDELEGYIGNMRIVNEDLCYHDIEVPVLYGRDGSQFNFYKKGGIEYLKVRDNVMISEDAIKALPNKKTQKVKIPSTGYGVYYKVDSKTSNKKATFTVPKNASFIIFDKDGTVVTNYYIDKKNNVTLPKNGMLLLLGDKNSKISISMK